MTFTVTTHSAWAGLDNVFLQFQLPEFFFEKCFHPLRRRCWRGIALHLTLQLHCQPECYQLFVHYKFLRNFVTSSI